jgi:hypothetical protein
MSPELRSVPDKKERNAAEDVPEPVEQENRPTIQRRDFNLHLHQNSMNTIK